MNIFMNGERIEQIKGFEVMDLFSGNRLISSAILETGLSPEDALTASYGIEDFLELQPDSLKGYVMTDEESDGVFTSLTQTSEKVCFWDNTEDTTAVSIEKYRELVAEWAHKIKQEGYDFRSTDYAKSRFANVLQMGQAKLAKDNA